MLCHITILPAFAAVAALSAAAAAAPKKPAKPAAPVPVEKDPLRADHVAKFIDKYDHDAEREAFFQTAGDDGELSRDEFYKSRDASRKKDQGKDIGDAVLLVRSYEHWGNAASRQDADGSGLAAPQVHVPRRVVICHVPEERAGETEESAQTPLTVLINPEIEPLSEEKKLGWEGCLSVPGLIGAVPRCTKIRYSGFAPDGSRIERVAEDFHARVVQHECDHLDGILYPQRMTDMSLLIFQEELRHGPPEAMREPTQEESEPV